MESFYGGRKGDSINIVARYTDIIDNQGKIITTAVEQMVEDFHQGAITTSKVGYGEYVLINTSFTKNENNGNLYRRGFDYNSDLIYRIRNTKAQKVSFPADIAIIISTKAGYSNINKLFNSPDEFHDEYYFKDPEEVSKINFDATLLSEIKIKEREQNVKESNKYSHYFYLYSGRGAEYLGRILGPIGETPTVTVDHYESIAKRSSFENNGSIIYNTTNADIYLGGPTDKDNEVKINWVNVEDVNGNVEEWLVGFKIPYLNPVFKTVMREPYYTKSVSDYEQIETIDEETGEVITDEIRQAYFKNEALPDGYSELITENENVKKPFYHEWTIEIPKGIKGDSVKEITFDAKTSKLFAKYINYDNYKQGEVSDFEEIGSANLIDEIVVNNGEVTGEVPSGHLLVRFTYDHNGPIRYNDKDGWYDLGLVKGAAAGQLCLYCRIKVENQDTVDAFVNTLNNLEDDNKITPENIYKIFYGKNTPLTAEEAIDSQNWTRDYSGELSNIVRDGWGILLTYNINKIENINIGHVDESELVLESETGQFESTVSYCVMYDYSLGKWYSVLLTSDGTAAPEKMLTSDPQSSDLLAYNGYYFEPIFIDSVFDHLK